MRGSCISIISSPAISAFGFDGGLGYNGPILLTSACA